MSFSQMLAKRLSYFSGFGHLGNDDEDKNDEGFWRRLLHVFITAVACAEGDKDAGGGGMSTGIIVFTLWYIGIWYNYYKCKYKSDGERDSNDQGNRSKKEPTPKPEKEAIPKKDKEPTPKQEKAPYPPPEVAYEEPAPGDEAWRAVDE